MCLGGTNINTRTWTSSGPWRLRWRQVTSLKPAISKRVYIVVKMFGKWVGGIFGARRYARARIEGRLDLHLACATEPSQLPRIAAYLPTAINATNSSRIGGQMKEALMDGLRGFRICGPDERVA